MAFSERQTAENFTPKPEVMKAIEERLVDGKMACASAFAIAQAYEVQPAEVGWTANVMEIRLTRCQLGLFGYPQRQGWHNSNVPDLPVPPGMPEAIESACKDNNTLSCSMAWQIAAQFETSRMLVGYIADKLGVKITSCQIGAF